VGAGWDGGGERMGRREWDGRREGDEGKDGGKIIADEEGKGRGGRYE